MLLEGVGKAALAFDREAYAELREALQKLAASLETTSDESELLGVAEIACETLATYNRDAQHFQAAQTVELRCMIEMLSQTLVSLADAGGQSVHTLQAIRHEVDRARQLDDIRLLRARLSDSLKAISDESRRQRDRNQTMLRQAKEAADIARGQHDTDVDRVSGLPSAQRAKNIIARRIGSESQAYAAVFVVERVESINLRYGYASGDQMLQAFGKKLMAELSLSDEVFRWRGPTFVVLLDRAAAADAVRAEVARFASTPQEHITEVDGRALKLPLSCAWTVVDVSSCQAAEQAWQQIDRFVAEHWEKRG